MSDGARWPRQDRPIVCAVDNDALADAVIAAAGELSRSLRLPLVFVHSVDPDIYVVGEAFRQRRADGESFAKSITSAHPDAERIVELGCPADLITAVSVDEDAALIVIGRRRRGALTAAILGSVSHAVARRARCPVVIVSDGAGATDIRPSQQVLDGSGATSKRRVAGSSPAGGASTRATAARAGAASSGRRSGAGTA